MAESLGQGLSKVLDFLSKNATVVVINNNSSAASAKQTSSGNRNRLYVPRVGSEGRVILETMDTLEAVSRATARPKQIIARMSRQRGFKSASSVS
jgi:hypothetical protein